MFIHNNRLSFYWLIGKSVYEKQKYFDNVIKKISNYYSYKYGLTNSFSAENVKYMKLFYLCFPVFSSSMNNLSWNHYKKLINIFDNKKRNFYYQISIICSLSCEDLNINLENYLYERI